MPSDKGLTFDLNLHQLRISTRWVPTRSERDVCRDIVERVTYAVPARESDPRARYVTMAKTYYDAMDAIRAAPSDALPASASGALLPSSLAVITMDATSAIGEMITSRTLDLLDDDTVRGFADDYEPDVLEYRRAVGLAGDADETFWTPGAPGAGPMWTVSSHPAVTETVATMPEPDPEPPDPEPEPPRRRRRFRWWTR